MPAVPFNQMPDDARVWIFAAVQPVLGNDADRLLEKAESFVQGWAAHGRPVVGSFDWQYDHFLIAAADERATGVSGCSIDSLFHTLQKAEHELGVSLLNSSLVWYRDDAGHVEACTRPEFRALVKADEVNGETIVFDNTAGTVGQIRYGQWERPLSESWHARAFGVEERIVGRG